MQSFPAYNQTQTTGNKGGYLLILGVRYMMIDWLCMNIGLLIARDPKSQYADGIIGAQFFMYKSTAIVSDKWEWILLEL